jgi:hypothetical protein
MTARITAIGDSQTDLLAGYGSRPTQRWTPTLAAMLGARCRVFGKSGDTSTQALARADVLHMYETPDLGLIYIGVNDPGASISTATTQANVQAMVKVLKYGATGPGAGTGGPCTVADQTALPASGRPGQRYIVLADSSTTGGAAAWANGQTATVTGAGGSTQTVWECRYPLAGEYGWGRVATATTAPTHCPRVVVVSTNYLNFTTGGDTLVTPYAAYATIRTALSAAVTAENVTVSGAASVVYADLYTFQKARIQAGTDLDFSAVSYDQTRSWHYTQNNQHHNPYGDQLVAQAVAAALPSAWTTALAAL